MSQSEINQLNRSARVNRSQMDQLHSSNRKEDCDVSVSPIRGGVPYTHTKVVNSQKFSYGRGTKSPYSRREPFPEPILHHTNADVQVLTSKQLMMKNLQMSTANRRI
jgi:hypothetical protein